MKISPLIGPWQLGHPRVQLKFVIQMVSKAKPHSLTSRKKSLKDLTSLLTNQIPKVLRLTQVIGLDRKQLQPILLTQIGIKKNRKRLTRPNQTGIKEGLGRPKLTTRIKPPLMTIDKRNNMIALKIVNLHQMVYQISTGPSSKWQTNYELNRRISLITFRTACNTLTIMISSGCPEKMV